MGVGVSYNLHRWYERGTGRYAKPDPMGRPTHDPRLFEAALADTERSSFFSYVAANPLTFIDPLGLFKTEGCSLSQSQAIRDAKKDYCARVALPAFATCCQRPKLQGKLRNLCGDASITVRCKSSCKQKPGFFNCGWSIPFGSTIRICPDAWAPGCGPLGCTLLHELTHISGHPREKVPDLVEKCLGCP